MSRRTPAKRTWPIEPPTSKNPGLSHVDSPTLPAGGGSAAERRAFAAQAFRLFCAKLITLITEVNRTLRVYHESGGTREKLKDYTKAIKAFKAFTAKPTVHDGLTPADPPPARVFTVERLSVKTREQGDYCVAVIIRGALVFQASGPTGESSSSSSSFPVLPPKW